MTYKVDGYIFQDNVDANRYLTLKNMKLNGRIKHFKVHPKIVLVKPYRRCPYCNTLSEQKECELCDSITCLSGGIRFHVDFLVIENDGRNIIEKVMRSPLTLSHEFHMKKILYDHVCSLPFRIVIDNVRYMKTIKGWVIDHAYL